MNDVYFWIAIAVYAFITLIASGVVITDYILRSFAIFRIATKRGITNAWLAWIPCLRTWTFGRIIDDFESEKGSKRKFRVILLVLLLVELLLACISAIVAVAVFMQLWNYGDYLTAAEEILIYVCLYTPLVIVSYVYFVYGIIALIGLHKVHEYIYPEKSIKYIVVSILVPLGASICLFENSKRCSEKRTVQPYYHTPELQAESTSGC